EEATSRPRPEIGGRKINWEYLAEMTESQCEWAFRFTQHKLRRLINTFEIPDPFCTNTGHCFPAIEAFGMLCARFRMPKDQYSLSTKYGRSQAAISELVNDLSKYITKTWEHLLLWDDKGVMHP
ncbi:hypothetical protein M422DRAFT_100084, partial [Sphaerobolus stellatus SS14]